MLPTTATSSTPSHVTPTVEAPSPSTSLAGSSHVTPTAEAPSPSTGSSHVTPTVEAPSPSTGSSHVTPTVEAPSPSTSLAGSTHVTPTVEAPSPSTSPTGYSHVTPTVEAPSPSTSPTGYSHVTRLNTTISPMSLGSTPHSCLTQSTPPVLTAQPSPTDARKALITTPVSLSRKVLSPSYNTVFEISKSNSHYSQVYKKKHPKWLCSCAH